MADGKKRFERILKDIKSLKIQGAENVAKAGVKAMLYLANSSKAKTKREFMREISSGKKRLFNTRKTEPGMRNAVNYILKDVHDDYVVNRIIKRINKNAGFVENYFNNAEKIIAKTGADKIKNNYVVFTHCHSSTVVNILKEAKKRKKHFEVHNTETRPLFQGRITAKELAKEGIKVVHYVDSAMRLALKKADIVLFGADAVQANGKVINKIGTELIAEIARKYDIPVYFCTTAWKFDPKTIYSIDEEIENRNKKEVWSKAPKNVKIMNPAFERTGPELITGIISELGVFRPSVFIEEVKQKYSWMFFED